MARILIIDDNVQILEILREILECKGYQVVDGLNGNQGIRLCREEQVDLVITDVIMPEKEGLETIMELRREFPDVKIIAISGGGRLGPDTYLPLAEKLGAQRTFAKPVRPKEILKAVRELVDKG